MKEVTKGAWIIFGIGLLSGWVYFFPWKDISWGRVVIDPIPSITTYGKAESKEKNQIAKFSAGLNVSKENRDEAIKEVNTKVAAIIQAVKEFGVDPADIITQSISINQYQDTYYEEGKQKQRPGSWNVGNTIEVTLRDINRASALANLLSSSGATNIWGPNFQLDSSNNLSNKLIEEAVDNARVKAEAMAKASGQKLGKILSIIDGYQNMPAVYPMMGGGMGGGGGAPVESGSATVSKTVTVVWSLE